MIDRFLAFSKENKLIEKGDSVLVGVSGGADSVVLLDILLKLKKKLSLEIDVAHVNYGLRKESDRDHKFVKNLAKKYEVPFFDKKMSLKGGNVEERARDIRYDFFSKIAEESGCNKIAVAHHKNDMVETFFLNAARGSGLTGLVSMKPKVNMLIRPLLFAAKSDIEAYAKKNKLRFVEDVTNKDLTIKRNLVRHEVISSMQKVNSDIVEVVAEEIVNLRKADDLIKEITQKHYKKLVKEHDNSVTLSAASLQKLHPYIRSEVLRKSILFVKGNLKNVSRKNIEDIFKMLETVHGTKKVMLSSSLIARRTYDKLEIRKETKSPKRKPKNTWLEMEKEIIFGKWRLFLGKTSRKNSTDNKNLVFLDIKKAHKLLVRCRKPGDRIKINYKNTKSLQDVFVDAKVPQKERSTYPVVVNEDDAVVWIPGVRVSYKYKDNLKSKDLVKIEAGKAVEKRKK